MTRHDFALIGAIFAAGALAAALFIVGATAK
jgi:hypothetical protein